MKPLLLHPDAEAELWEAADFYETRRAGLGLTFEQNVRQALISIQESPSTWPKREHGTRCLILRRFPFCIHYLELMDAIWIVAIAHSKRRPYYWRRRIQEHEY